MITALEALRIHTGFELAAYALGTHLFRRASSAEPLRTGRRESVEIAIGTIFGALLGSKSLSFLQEAPALGFWSAIANGKTIVGGLLGGWIGTEIAKKLTGVTEKTGDRFVLPLAAGIIVGRIGCFLAGIYDGTFGTVTDMPWGIDFGDGRQRHPTQLYEIGFLALTWVGLRRVPGSAPAGARFRIFLAAYFGFRLVCDFWKEDPRWLGAFSVIQIASLLGAAWSLISLHWLRRDHDR